MSSRKWNDIRQKQPPTAESEATLRDERERVQLALALAPARRERGMTQAQVAERLGIAQPNVSQIESGNDPQLGTLARYVEALGGRLEVRAVFDDATALALTPGVTSEVETTVLAPEPTPELLVALEDSLQAASDAIAASLSVFETRGSARRGTISPKNTGGTSVAGTHKA